MNREQGTAQCAGQDESHAPRLYRRVAAQLMDEVRAGRYPVGARMPAERELAVQMGVSRPIVREALLALEVMGIVEVKLGSGAYVLRSPEDEPVAIDASEVTPIELAQARLIFEGEAASLAAVNIAEEELALMDQAVADMNREDGTFEDWQAALTLFHLTMAKATRNVAVERGVRDLWDMRSRSPECRRMLEEARNYNYRYSLEQHVEILAALRAHDAERARAAVRMHLQGSINHVLMALEERAVADARARVAEIRSRYSTDGKR
ncbi:FadR/GntR family transcriptional regulator [Novosphingobium sp. AP12]|uniref:FadR/GntR family transcriptional regulator n=1 Tax=Novosphingobium sp. AP12 TaxID=1144305 RepID=UPI000271DD8A|nr:FadR/GntR family transcriptional regulator [Novosphingobium sp. AP12]EJL27503.1 transcriptional regulator [Novosphingobium sp. AP12]